MPKSPESTNSVSPDNPAPKSDGGASTSRTEDARASPKPAAAQQATGKRMVSKRKEQFLIAPRSHGLREMGLEPLQFSMVEQTLRAQSDIEVVDTVGPRNVVGALSAGLGDMTGLLVARMTDQKATMLYQQAQGRLLVERDQPLELHDPAFMPPFVTGGAPGTGPVLAAAFAVVGVDGTPLPGAQVYLFGSLLPVSGMTNDQGVVTLTLFGETPQSIRGLYVKPKADYWSFYQESPDISSDEVNVVALRPISDFPSLSNFPGQQVLGWGQKAMRLDQLPGSYRGQGIKVAVIDSGAANSHEDLRNIRFGFDIINKKVNPETWNEDLIAHGSHCAGVIAGADNARGVRGFAPDAEVHACKLFPGGQISQLIDALEYCIEKQIDVVNLSLGGAEPSEALEQQILRAKRAGIACIVAAGNSGSRVQYPASSPNVLAVAAIGRLNEFPQDSYHTQTVTRGIDPNGFYSAKFSCFGPEIAVCAPGVAIASSVPDNDYAVWDGTSMAAPHVTGLAALVLAHHPDFQTTFRNRGAERVERLFQIIKLSARPLNLGDPSRTGYGLPDVLIALGLQPSAGISPQAAMDVMLMNNPALAAMLSGAMQGGMYPPPPPDIGRFGTAYREQAQFAPAGWEPGTWGQAGRPGSGTIMPISRGGGINVVMTPFGTFGVPPASFGQAGWMPSI